MSVTTRQNRLLLAQDWTKVYQSFRNADFTSYDFENLRRTMIDYIRTNYPEDFNDYIESSEYLALIDLIAFLGQSIAFRADLNARDNFLELAERRDSVLRLARMISYNAKRTTAASGLLKITSVTTDERILDANGRNLANQPITWNDASNANWYDQFIKVINAAFPSTQQYGNPAASANIYGIPTQQYRFNSNLTGVPIFTFNKNVAGRSMNFEISNATFSGTNYIYEEAPKLGNTLTCLYRDDGHGPGSSASGFFMHFVQGTLNQGLFTISQPSSNQSIDIDANNINNSDVWLYRLDTNGLESELWTQIPTLSGNNVIYNSLNKKIKNIYAVVTRTDDAVSLQFSDGTFGTLPLGNFRTYYRTSNGLSYTINSADIKNVAITVPYTGTNGQAQQISITLSLTSSVANAALSESNASIKTNAPQTYYTQNRMITAEDYNISPLSASTQVAKIKAINRTSSGISRYFDLIDPTGKYGSTTLFGTDGVLYNETYNSTYLFSYLTKTNIQNVIYNNIYDILKHDNLKNYYYSQYINTLSTNLSVAWQQVTNDTTSSTGYVSNLTQTGIPLPVGTFTPTDFTFLKNFQVGSLVKFVAPSGYYFDTTNYNKLTAGLANTPGAVTYLWASVTVVVDDGTAGYKTTATTVLDSGLGPVTLNKDIPTGAILSQIIPPWVTTIPNSVVTTMIDLIFANKKFGLRYDATNQIWQIIYETNLNTSNIFSLGKTGDQTNQNQDSSWLLLFTTDNVTYTVTSREQRYIFESKNQVSFYFDSSKKIYDSVNNQIVVDTINVLSVNTAPNGLSPFTVDYNWDIVKEWVGIDGYVDNSKLVIAFKDSDSNGVVDNPQLFLDLVTPSFSTTAIGTVYQNTIVVADASGIVRNMQVSGIGISAGAVVVSVAGNTVTLSSTNTNNMNNQAVTFTLITYIAEKKYTITQGQEDYRYSTAIADGTVKLVATDSAIGALTNYTDGQYFYITSTGIVKKLNLTSATLVPTADYKVYVGRDNLKFQYVHNADYESRIDPGASNIVDVYVLTQTYDTDFRRWVSGALASQPLPAGSDELFDTLNPNLSLIKSLSDEIIYHPVAYKQLFGQTAAPELQASFKVIKNASEVLSDNDIKSRIITAINDYFSLGNWDFGDTFYFTELATYVMTQLAPDLSSFVIVPRLSGLGFGSLFEVTSASNELFISTATVADIDIITDITATGIKSIAGTTTTSTTAGSQIISSSTYGSLNG